jgi:competence protein ComGC
MKRGFTLIEMLGIITVLAILLLITYPNLSKSLKEMKDNKTKNFTNNLKVSTESYVELNRNKYPELYKPYGRVEIKIQELYDANLMSGQPENASMNDTVTVLATENLELKYFFNNKQIGYGVDPNDNSLTICDNITTFCITSRSDLEQLATEVNNGDNKSGKTYILTQDIDLGGLFDENGNPQTGNNPWTPIGSESKHFSGTFDGAGHIITGMYIDVDATQVGLFSTINGGTIKNLGIENSYVKSSANRVGSIIGALTNGSISNCYNKATISGKKFSGGIAGNIEVSTIKNCYNTGNINSNGQQFAAGIVGYVSNTNSVVENCYNAGTINGANQPGGIIGGLQGKALNNYNLGTVYATGTNGGGIVGQLYAPISPLVNGNYNTGTANGGIISSITSTGNYTVTNNYFLNTSATYGIKSTSSNEGTEPLTIDKMPTVISVINGDNAFVEDTKGRNGGNPILKWQQ